MVDHEALENHEGVMGLWEDFRGPEMQFGVMGDHEKGTWDQGARVALGALWLTMRPWRTMLDHGRVMGLWGVLKDRRRWFGVIRDHWAVVIMGTMGD